MNFTAEPEPSFIPAYLREEEEAAKPEKRHDAASDDRQINTKKLSETLVLNCIPSRGQ